METIIKDLNDQQRKAVTHDSCGRLQIIAGPGTGKTKVLISRVAYLLLEKQINPETIIVTTFTKKAANEIVERLSPVLKNSNIDATKLLVGTFHSICYRIIRRYGNKLNLNNYTIADERDSMQILQEIIEGLTEDDLQYLQGLPEEETQRFLAQNPKTDKYHGYDPKAFKRNISKLKSSGVRAADYYSVLNHKKPLLLVYQRYQEKLQKEFLLDFDDCLLECYTLISRYPVLNFVQHVLVDEFQDTNEIQLQLMIEFGRGHPSDKSLQHNVTLVGDPDQSIYAFRDAKSTNFKAMKQYYEKNLSLPVLTVSLVENYRSTSDILNVSETIMSQQSDRKSKKLLSQLDSTFKTVHKTLSSTYEEARWIVYQIVYLTSLPLSIFKYLDISVLVRASYQTRVIENELVKMRIPYFMVRGKAFWDRKEVTVILDYLRAISNSNDRAAYVRTLGFPKRGVGEKSMEQINGYLGSKVGGDLTIHELLKNPSISLPKGILNTIDSHLSFIEDMRGRISYFNELEEGDEKKMILEEFFNDVYTQLGLKKAFESQSDQDANIMEVGKQLLEFEPQDDSLPLYLGGEDSELAGDDRNYIAKFITSIGLYEHVEDEEDEGKDGKGKVSLSTIHGAKGLEWPIVFVPGLSEGSLPSSFALNGSTLNTPNKKKASETEALDEERRCFYVATTRAKTLLHISSIVEQSSEFKWKALTKVSRFISHIINNCSGFHECFRDLNNLKKLYEIRNLPVPRTQDFDVDSYYKGYRRKFDSFVVQGERRLDPFDFSGLNDEYGDSYNKLPYNGFNNPQLTSAIFSTARSQMDDMNQKRKYDDIVEARKRLAKKKTKFQQGGLSKLHGQFKPHRPVMANNTTSNSTNAKPMNRSFAPK